MHNMDNGSNTEVVNVQKTMLQTAQPVRTNFVRAQKGKRPRGTVTQQVQEVREGTMALVPMQSGEILMISMEESSKEESLLGLSWRYGG